MPTGILAIEIELRFLYVSFDLALVRETERKTERKTEIDKQRVGRRSAANINANRH